MASPTHSERRVKTLTDKGLERFQKQADKKATKLIQSRKSIEQLIISFRTNEHDEETVIEVRQKLNKCFSDYDLEFQDYIQFLSNTYTVDSLEEKKSQETIHRTVSENVEKALHEMDIVNTGFQIPYRNLNQSEKTAKSERTTSSVQSSVIARQKAKAEAAKAKLEFMKKEAELLKEKARLEEEQLKIQAASERKQKELDAEIQVLDKEKDAVVAEVELHALEEDASEFGSVRGNSIKKIDEQLPRPFQYVQTPVPRRMLPTTDLDSYIAKPNLNPDAKPFLPKQFTDLSKYLLKKDLLLERFSKFDDNPENFNIWKSSFCSIIKELDATPAEEFDLLIKYLGPESKRHAVSLRTSNADNLENGLERLWDRLYERYGSPEKMESALKKKLDKFPRLTGRDHQRLFDLSDILAEIESAKQDPKYTTLLSYFDSSTGVLPIVNKLPSHLQSKWMNRAMTYKKVHSVYFPPFAEFCEFIREMSTMYNDPGLSYTVSNDRHHDKQGFDSRRTNSYRQERVNVRKTFVQKFDTCPIHHGLNHSLNQCKTFKSKSVTERKKYLRENNICYKCCNSNGHTYNTCPSSISCDECGSDRHPAALHYFQQAPSSPASKQQGREGPAPRNIQRDREPAPRQGTSVRDCSEQVSNMCTSVCGKGFSGRSCSKTVLVKVYPDGEEGKAKTVYCILDDQSNRTLCRPELFSLLDISSGTNKQYTLVSCAGSHPTQGRCVRGLTVSAMDNSFSLLLPSDLECTQIPNTRSEIPTPEVTKHHAHLRDVPIPPIDYDSDILLLIGRDIPEAHHVFDQRIGPPNSPFAQRLGLGWVIIGEVCLGNAHRQERVNVLKTHVMNNGRSTVFPPCDSKLTVKCYSYDVNLDTDVFCQTDHDNKLGLSIEDKAFLEMMDENFIKDESSGKWSAPLPFRSPRPRLPNNKSQALKRAQVLDASLRRNLLKQQHFVEFMEKIIENGHAEVAPSLKDGEECWYLPIFGVYHPKKKDKIRVVFDSSAKFEGVSLNNVLMSGPDLTNSLTGIMIRFRQGDVAVTGDIEQMFYQFNVHEKDRNYLRFLWYRDNDLNNGLVEYRMRVHVFGNSPSPAVATYGLQKTALNAAEKYGQDILNFVTNNFYVDDGLASLDSASQAISLIKRTQQALMEEGGLSFHKIMSNNLEVLRGFPEEDLVKDLKELDLDKDTLPIQRSLGLYWDLNSDSFLFRISEHMRETHTKRSVLSTINSLYDPLGFLAPVTIGGKILLRDITCEVSEWDEPLPDHLCEKWESWERSLQDLKGIQIPRTYFRPGVVRHTAQTLHVFCDASEMAIAAVAYLKTTDGYQNTHVGYVFGKSKVAPKHGHTIPRLELCAAVLAVEIAEVVSGELSIPSDRIFFYTDSRVVLGYLTNKTRRFYVYVANMVSRILKFSTSDQWSYVETENNPADHGTRYTNPTVLGQCSWLSGKPFLTTPHNTDDNKDFALIYPDNDVEVRPDVRAIKTTTEPKRELGTERFLKFSSWKKMLIAISLLVHIARSFKNMTDGMCRLWHWCKAFKTVESQKSAKYFIIQQVQQEVYARELQYLKENKLVPKDSSVFTLSPFLDDQGILRVGGRLRKSHLSIDEKNPILLPGHCHIALLLVRHYHESVHHQGRHLTEGALRAAGFWLTGGKRLISHLIHKCVTCRKLRGKLSEQRMSDLPVDRLTPAPPFTFVGVDAFGPWNIVSRRTRGGVASAKRWAVLFVCQSTRAVHLELIEEMSSSSFINALRRFYAIRGKVQEFRSDRGTNFVGATGSLEIDAINVEDGPVKDFLYDSGTIWKFNTPHSSHMGGSWERMIGITRRILDAILLESRNKQLTHEVLSTFLAEVSSIVNSRPIVPVSSDPENPFILTPSVLLTQKTADSTVESYQHLDVKDMYRSQWKFVQVLANTFWKRWRQEYLPTLQQRKIWQNQVPNFKTGDIVLVREKSLSRNEWPIGIISRVFESDDNLVRKVEIKVNQCGKQTSYIRPIIELVKLL